MRRERRRYDRNMKKPQTVAQGNRWARTVLWAQTKGEAELKLALQTKNMYDYPSNSISLEEYKNYTEQIVKLGLELEHRLDSHLALQRASQTDLNAIEWHLKNKADLQLDGDSEFNNPR